MHKNIDLMGEEIFLIDDVEQQGRVAKWWTDLYNYGSFIQGFLAYGGNPPHPSMDKTGDPEMIKKVREEGGFSNKITGTLEKNTWYMNVSVSYTHLRAHET